MGLPEFQNEKEFRDNWIAPFLAKLGFILVKNTHGPGEQGKDFFFADYDRFGHTRVFAAQVKLGNIGSGSTEIADLLDQVKRCFGVKLRFHKTAHEQRIAAVYVMTNGTISDTARIRIHDWCNDEKCGENVFFLDGEQLENKERFATYESDTERRQHLTAFRNELFRNGLRLKDQLKLFEKGTDQLDVFRTNALEDALLRMPRGGDVVLNGKMEELWYYLTLFKEHKSPFNLGLTQDAIDQFRGFTNVCITNAEFLMNYCEEELRILNQRYSLEAVTINDDAE